MPPVFSAFSLSALDPGKQGLKQRTLHCHRLQNQLSALDPGKQGLKLIVLKVGPLNPKSFSA